MLIIEDIPINDFQNAIENSFYNISSHAGYFVHTSLALKKKTIDIINEKDEKGYLRGFLILKTTNLFINQKVIIL